MWVFFPFWWWTNALLMISPISRYGHSYPRFFTIVFSPDEVILHWDRETYSNMLKATASKRQRCSNGQHYGWCLDQVSNLAPRSSIIASAFSCFSQWGFLWPRAKIISAINCVWTSFQLLYIALGFKCNCEMSVLNLSTGGQGSSKDLADALWRI